jgi:hypothetical protein
MTGSLQLKLYLYAINTTARILKHHYQNMVLIWKYILSACNNMCVGLDLVVQIHTAGGYIDQQTHEYVYCNSCNVRW